MSATHPLDSVVVARSPLGVEFTRATLAAAFAAVEPAGNWKLPIDATLAPARVRELGGLYALREAVVFFAGCLPEIDEVHGGALRVRAAGYYAAVGA